MCWGMQQGAGNHQAPWRFCSCKVGSEGMQAGYVTSQQVLLHHRYVKNVRPILPSRLQAGWGSPPPLVAIWWQGLREFVHRILGHVQRFQGHARGVHRFDLVHHGAPDGNGPGYPGSEKPVDRTRTWPHNERRSHRNHMFRFCLSKNSKVFGDSGLPQRYGLCRLVWRNPREKAEGEWRPVARSDNFLTE